MQNRSRGMLRLLLPQKAASRRRVGHCGVAFFIFAGLGWYWVGVGFWTLSKAACGSPRQAARAVMQAILGDRT